ncbi:MAG TPA: hypothetical protein VK996_19975 [Ramlibacter sp.]|nr:hypothetical protein [Ramlibacter sp.]
MTTAEYLAQFGVTMDQAYDFIVAHRDEPAFIFEVAHQSGITNEMLGDIVGYSAADVRGYFNANGLDASQLDPALELAHLFPDDMGELAGLVALDPYQSGELSVAALRGRVIAATNSADYFETFDPANFYGAEDGFFTPDELGVSHLGTLPATTETLESLFYGTIIATLKSVDYGEAIQVAAFIGSNEAALEAGDEAATDEFIDLLVSVFSDPAASDFWNPASYPAIPSAEIAEAAAGAGISLVQLVGEANPANLFEGLLDTYIG